MTTSRQTKTPRQTSARRGKKGKAEPKKEKSLLREAMGGSSSDPVSRKETLRIVTGVLMVVLAAFSLLSFISFLFTGGADQRVLGAGGSNIHTTNLMGYLGAWWSDYWMNDNFGFGSFFLPVIVAAAGLKCIGDYGIRLWKWFVNCTFLTVWFSVASHYFLQSWLASSPDTSFIAAGGIHGQRIAGAIEPVIGSLGLLVLILIVMVAYLCYVSAEVYRQVRRLLHPQRMMRELRADHPWFDKGIGMLNKVGRRGDKENIDLDEDEDEVEAPLEEADDDMEPDGLKTSDSETTADESDFSDVPEAVLYSSQKQQPADTGKHDTDEPWIKVAQGDDDSRDEVDGGSGVTLEIVPAVEEEQADAESKAALEPYDPKLDLSMYKYPTLDLLKHYDSQQRASVDDEEYTRNKQQIENVLKSFGVSISKIRATIGPTITLYEITPAPGVRISKIRNLEDDIALSLSALGIRIIAPMPGQGTIGIEVPNAKPQIVSMESILNSRKFQESNYELPMALGKTITNEVFMVDLAKMPHLLVAGATGQGKSAGLNAIITSLLYKKHPAELKLVMVDPKKVEFSIYSPIVNHFLAQIEDEEDEPIITDVQKVINTLKSLCVEMDSRYDLLKRARARNIKEYNEKFKNRILLPEKGHRFMPYIVVIIDEFGDLIMTAGKEIELPIARIAQLARAVGIHMIIATQRPTTNIITGTIKANFPARMAFKVSAMVDSRTILDRPGANQLVGKGDMLFLAGNDPVRVQCAFVDTPEVENICSFIACQQGYDRPFALPRPPMEDAGGSGAADVDMQHLDPMFADAAKLIVQTQQGSTSMIQRKFSIGFNRAGRLMDQLEKAGVVGQAQGSKPREVLIQDDMSLEILLNNLN